MCRSELLNLLDFLKEIMPFAYLTKSPKLHLETGNKYAIGIVIQPGPQGVMGAMKLFLTNPSQVANFWGHTAIYIRINGSIVKATGFDPHRFAMFNIMGKESRGVATGTLATKGYIYDEDKMFSSPDMICVEFKVNKNDAEKILKHTKKPGISEGLMTQYVTRGGQCLKDMEFDPKTMGNCINYVNSIIKKANIELHVPFERDGHLSLLRPAQGKLITPAMNGEIKLKRRVNGIVSYNGGGVFTMPKMYQITRRMGGALRTVSFLRCTAAVVTNLGMTNATQCSKSDVMFTLALILDFAMETLPNDSSFWNLPVGLIEGILSAGATLALGITMYSGDPGAWYPAIMSLLMLLFSLFI